MMNLRCGRMMGKIKYRTCQHFRPPVRAEPVRKNKNISTGITKNKKGKERMNDMVTFMASRIIEEAEKSVEAGQKKYRAYFVKTRLYKRWKDNVDTILKTDGYDEVIVEN